MGGTIGFGITSTGSVGQSNTNSTYSSVIEQSGIYAGTGGFDITVNGNTDLTGAVISSTADASKNTLTTGSLTYSDINNSASYSSSSMGISYSSTSDKSNNITKGITPVIGVTASGDASSTTNSAISAGTITVKSVNTDLSNLSRDTENSVNALGQIFDKKTVAEQQELAKLFGEVVYKAIGDLNLPVGSLEKAMLDALAGGIMSKLGGSDFASGAVGAGFTQLVMNELRSTIKDPAAQQWAAAILGAAAAKVVNGDAKAGASVAVSEIKNNEQNLEHIKQYIISQYEQSIKSNIYSMIEAGVMPALEDMTHDYYFVMGGASLPLKFVSGSFGYIVDKYGNVYGLLEADGGFGVSTFTTTTVGFGDFKASKSSSDEYISAIEGGSFGGGGSAGVQVTASISSSGVVSTEVSGTTAAGVTLLSGRYALYLFNLKE